MYMLLAEEDVFELMSTNLHCWQASVVSAHTGTTHCKHGTRACSTLHLKVT